VAVLGGLHEEHPQLIAYYYDSVFERLADLLVTRTVRRDHGTVGQVTDAGHPD
jgi:hypothetical protein